MTHNPQPTKPPFLILSLGEEPAFRNCILYHRPSEQIWLSVGLIFHVTNDTPGDLVEMHNLDQGFLYQGIPWFPLADVAEYLAMKSSKTKRELMMATINAVQAVLADDEE